MSTQRSCGPGAMMIGVVPRRFPCVAVLVVALLVVASCSSDGSGPTMTTTTTSPAPVPSTTTSTAPSDAPEEAPAAVDQEVWKFLGGAVLGDEYGGLADFKVGQFGDGTYIGVAHAPLSGRGSIVFTSTDLVDWDYVSEIGPGDTWFNEGFHGGFITLEDGRVRMYWVELADPNRQLMGVATATTPDGVTWTRDPGWRVTDDDFGDDVVLDNLSIVPRSEGGWRMYVSFRDCQIPNLFGDPNCEAEDPEWGYAELAVFTIRSAVSDDTMNWAVEPGTRFQSSFEEGSMHHPHAWIDPQGRTRISSHGTPRLLAGDEAPLSPTVTEFGGDDGHPGWSLAGRAAFATIVSDDGLDFHTYLEQSAPAADPYVVSGPDGRLFMFGSPGAGTVSMDINRWEFTAVAWEIDHPARVGIEYDFDAGGHATVCFRIDFRGEGRFTLEVYGGGSTFSPPPAHPDTYWIDQPVIDAPGTAFIKTREWTEDGRELGDEIPTHAVATDENGVRWWMVLYPHTPLIPGEGCKF